MLLFQVGRDRDLQGPSVTHGGKEVWNGPGNPATRPPGGAALLSFTEASASALISSGGHCTYTPTLKTQLPLNHFLFLFLSVARMQIFPRDTLTGLSLPTMKSTVGTKSSQGPQHPASGDDY